MNGKLGEPTSGAWVLEFERPVRISGQERKQLVVRGDNLGFEKFIGHKVQIKGLAKQLGASIVLEASAINSLESDTGKPAEPKALANA